MNILIDISHPAHVHLLRNTYSMLVSDGNLVIVVVKDIPSAKKLLDIYGIPYIIIGNKRDSLYKKGIDEKDFKEKVLGMVLYNEPIPEEYRKLVTIRKDTEKIDTSTWKPFEYQRLFRIEKGERLTKANMK